MTASPDRDASDVTFERWVQWAFDHPLSSPPWYWDYESEDLEPKDPSTSTAYLTRLFLDPLRYFSRFLDGQISQGLWLLLSSDHSEHLHSLGHESVPIEDKIACIESMFFPYRDLFAGRCLTSHRARIGDRGSERPLDSICYMWWDMAPLISNDTEDQAAMIAAEIRTLARILELEDIACQKGALHGLGHRLHSDPQAVREIIERYLNALPTGHELAEYAQKAITGSVL